MPESSEASQSRPDTVGSAPRETISGWFRKSLSPNPDMQRATAVRSRRDSSTVTADEALNISRANATKPPKIVESSAIEGEPLAEGSSPIAIRKRSNSSKTLENSHQMIAFTASGGTNVRFETTLAVDQRVATTSTPASAFTDVVSLVTDSRPAPTGGPRLVAPSRTDTSVRPASQTSALQSSATPTGQHRDNISVIMAAVFGTVGGFVLCAIVLVFLVRCKRWTRIRREKQSRLYDGMHSVHFYQPDDSVEAVKPPAEIPESPFDSKELLRIQTLLRTPSIPERNAHRKNMRFYQHRPRPQITPTRPAPPPPTTIRDPPESQLKQPSPAAQKPLRFVSSPAKSATVESPESGLDSLNSGDREGLSLSEPRTDTGPMQRAISVSSSVYSPCPNRFSMDTRPRTRYIPPLRVNGEYANGEYVSPRTSNPPDRETPQFTSRMQTECILEESGQSSETVVAEDGLPYISQGETTVDLSEMIEQILYANGSEATLNDGATGQERLQPLEELPSPLNLNDEYPEFDFREPDAMPPHENPFFSSLQDSQFVKRASVQTDSEAKSPGFEDYLVFINDGPSPAAASDAGNANPTPLRTKRAREFDAYDNYLAFTEAARSEAVSHPLKPPLTSEAASLTEGKTQHNSDPRASMSNPDEYEDYLAFIQEY